MHHGGAMAFAEADDAHFQEAAAEGAEEIGVRLDAVDEQDAIGGEGVGAAMDRHAILGRTDLARLQRSKNRHAHRRLGDVVAGQDLALALGRRSAVAAHGWDDERLRTCAAKFREYRLHDFSEVCDPATPHAHRDARSRLDLRAQLGELSRNRRRNIHGRCGREILPQAEDAGERSHAE